MKYFKDNLGNVFAYDESQIAMGLAIAKTPMTLKEVEAHKTPLKTKYEEQSLINATSRLYLASTDWYIIRYQETGVEVPEEVTVKRTAARNSIVTLSI